jgi:hypothetical protein
MAGWRREVGHCLAMVIGHLGVATTASSRALGTVRAQVVAAHVSIGVQTL